MSDKEKLLIVVVVFFLWWRWRSSTSAVATASAGYTTGSGPVMVQTSIPPSAGNLRNYGTIAAKPIFIEAY